MDPHSLGLLAREGQERKAGKMRTLSEPYSVDVLGKKITVLPNVFSPAADTLLLIRSVKVTKTDVVLEPFAGTGVISIFLAEDAASAVATDINPNAVENINKNIRMNHMENKITAVRADIFPDDERKFDVIVANPPYTDNEAKDVVEKAFWDKGHETVKSFLLNAKGHLTSSGKIYSSWSNFGDFDLFNEMVKNSGYNIRQISQTEKDWQIYRVYEITQ